MVAPAIPIAIAAGSSIAGMMGSRKANKAMKQALEEQVRMRREAAGLYDQLTPPTASEMAVAVDDLQQQGLITPEMANSIKMEQSAMEDVQRGGAGREAEFEALNELRNISGSGGLTATDRAKIQDIQDQMNTAGRGARGAITQNFAERGISGSGMEYMEKLMAQQQGASDASRQGLDVAAMAEQRALEAIMAQAGLGDQISQEEFGEQSDIARAKDAIEQFNTTNRRDIELENVRARNAAQEGNLREAQRLSDVNVQQQNLEKLRRADLKQQEFENNLAKTSGKAAALSGGNAAAINAAKSSQDMYGRLIGVGGQIAAATAPYWGNGGNTAQPQQQTANTAMGYNTPVAPDDEWKKRTTGWQY